MGPVISLFGRPLWRENLVWLELASALRELPKPSRANDPRPTLLIPGFFSGDRHLVIMKHWLERAGHATQSAGIRWNIDWFLRTSDAPIGPQTSTVICAPAVTNN